MWTGIFERCMGFTLVVLILLYGAQAVELTRFRRQVDQVGAQTRQVVERRAQLLDMAGLDQ